MAYIFGDADGPAVRIVEALDTMWSSPVFSQKAMTPWPCQGYGAGSNGWHMFGSFNRPKFRPDEFYAVFRRAQDNGSSRYSGRLRVRGCEGFKLRMPSHPGVREGVAMTGLLVS